jgi:hypothetical protein
MAGLILITFISEACSPPAALVVLACVVVRAAGCHAFCTLRCWPSLDPLLSTTNHTQAKNHASPCSCGRCLISNTNRGLSHSSQRTHSYLLRAISAHTLSPLAGFTPIRSVHPWRLARRKSTHRTSDTQIN